MIKTIKKGFFPFIIAFSALSVSASAAFYSVFGLSKLFAGASFQVIIMAGSLEVAKLVTASLLYQYWDTINKALRTYLTIATFILVLITSMGIYGFLSAAYQETYSKLLVQENQIEFIENKAKFYEEDIARYDIELSRISDNINILSNAKASGIQVRDTTSSTGFRQTISTTELRMAQKRIEVEEDNRKSVQAKREVAADSLQTFRLQILELQNNSETAGELGPLQYLSGLTDTPMDKIINWLLLIIIFVFDPLAISLVVAANFAFAQAFPKREEEEVMPSNSVWDNIEDELNEEEKEWSESLEEPRDDDYYDNRGSVYYDEEYDDKDWKVENTADTMAKPTVPFDISANKEDAQAWYDLADQIAKDSAELEDEDLPRDYELEYEEPNYDHLKDHVDMKEEQMQDTAFVDFQNKMDENDAAREIDVVEPEEVSKVDDTEMETDRTGTFPNENNPTSVAAVVKNLPNEFGTYPSTVEKIETPHLPKEEEKTIEKKKNTPVKKQGPSDDELFDIAMRKKAEEDKQQFLKDRDGNSKK